MVALLQEGQGWEQSVVGWGRLLLGWGLPLIGWGQLTVDWRRLGWADLARTGWQGLGAGQERRVRRRPAFAAARGCRTGVPWPAPCPPSAAGKRTSFAQRL